MSPMNRRLFMGAAAAASTLPSASLARPEPAWQARAPMPWVAQEIYCTQLEGRVWVAGGLVRGRSGTLINDRTAIYDPVGDSWTEGPRLPQPRHHPMLVAALGRVWVFGGYDRRDGGEWTAMKEVWALDQGDWAPVGQMPDFLCETVGLALGDHIHLVTGRAPKGTANGQWNDQGDVATHLVFDASANRWHQARPAPMARNSAAGAVLDGKLYIAGGRTVEGGGTGRLDVYDPAADRWDTLAPIPPSPATGQQVGGGLAMVETGGRLFAFGGEWFAGDGGVFAETWIYDPVRDAWSRGPDMKTPRHGLAGIQVGGQALAIAGGEVVSGGRASARVEAISL